MKRIFIDMDGVTVDFEALMGELGVTNEVLKRMPGAYARMPPMPGAIDGVRRLIAMGYECWFATKPPTGAPHAYADKVTWVIEHLPELTARIVITHDKGLLGDESDYLIDDRPDRANARKFRGKLVHFSDALGWDEVLQFFVDEEARPYQGLAPAALTELGIAIDQLFAGRRLVPSIGGQQSGLEQYSLRFSGAQYSEVFEKLSKLNSALQAEAVEISTDASCR